MGPLPAHPAPYVADRSPADRDRLSVQIFVCWLATGVIEGPLRGGLSTVGLANVLYLRDLVMVAATALAFLRPWTRGEPLAPGLVLMGWGFGVHLCIAILVGGNLFNALFGMKIFFPVLYAVAIYPAAQKNFPLLCRAMTVFFIVSVAGVFANHLLGPMPWEGLAYDTAFGSVQTTRVWWMEGGLRRLQGFARASFDAAMILGVSGVVVLATARRAWVRMLVASLTLWAIVLTTSKGMVLAFAIASLWLVPSPRTPASFGIGRLLAAALLVLTCALPTTFAVVQVSEYPVDIPPLLSSMWDRFSWMWPMAFASVPDHFGAITGAGFGGIGTPQGLVPRPNSADSVFAYYYATFGLIGLAYLAFPLLAVMRRQAENDRQGFVWAGLLIIAYGYGLATNMIEQPFFCGVFGLLYGKAFADWRASRA